jgi:short-subunit dehydrogenase
MIRDVRGKLIVVTGASRGLGARIAEALAARGARLVLTARTEAALQEVAARCRAAGSEVVVVAADVAAASGREAVLAAAREAGGLDGLVNNAGIEHTVALVDQDPADIEAQIAINLTAAIQLTRAVLPDLLARGAGAVVAVSSMSGKAATPYNSVYAATKHGLVGFTASLRCELHGTGVHAGVVCPGFVGETGMWADTGVKAPPALREVSPDAVVAATLRALAGAPEELVTAAPMRPLLALQALFPRLDGAVLRALGVTAALKARAEVAAGRS